MKKKKIIYICYSCITGEPVWVYQGQSLAGRDKAYQRSRKKEVALARHWPVIKQRWQDNVLHLLEECMSRLPIFGSLTKDQRAAVRELRRMAGRPPQYHSGFYNHIRGERRRRDKKTRRWCTNDRKSQNTDYVKQGSADDTHNS